MKKSDAMNLLNMTVFSHKILKQAYLKACFKYHPDRNSPTASLEIMKAVNLAYTFLKTLPDVDETEATESTGIDFGEVMNTALNAVIDFEGVLIEICGNWIWLTGNTKPYKDRIKAAGYYWASKKNSWYFRPAEWKSSSRGRYDMDTIREKFGSDSVKNSKPKMKIEEAA